VRPDVRGRLLSWNITFASGDDMEWEGHPLL